MMVIAIVVLGGAYLLYGRYLEKNGESIPMQRLRLMKWKTVWIMSLRIPTWYSGINLHP